VAGCTKMVYPQTVTHPSINRTRRRVITLIETNALPLSQATTFLKYTVYEKNIKKLLYRTNRFVVLNVQFCITKNTIAYGQLV